jgi:hypothetical protein
MSEPTTCPHAEATTLAWIHGEGDEDHVHHVASCPDCSRVLELHSEVLAQVGPVLDDLPRPVPAAVAPEAPAGVAPANRPWLLGVVLAMATAAAVVLAVWSGPSRDAEPVQVEADAPPPVADPLTPPPPTVAAAPDEASPLPEPAPDAAPVPAPVPPPLEVVEAPPPVRRAAPSDAEAAAALEALLADLDDPLDPGDPVDEGLDGLFDDFAALEAGLTTL